MPLSTRNVPVVVCNQTDAANKTTTNTHDLRITRLSVPQRHDCRFGKPTPRHATNPLFRVSSILPELLTFRGIIHHVRHKPRCGGSSENPHSPCLSMFTALSVLENLRRFPSCLIYRAGVLRYLTCGLYIGRPFCHVKRNQFAINRREAGGNTSDRRQDGNPTHPFGAIGGPGAFVLQLDCRTIFERRLSKQYESTCASPGGCLGALRW